MNGQAKRVAVVGSGPAALMAAYELSKQNISVTIFEKRSLVGWKLLVAGSSGLNIGNDYPIGEFLKYLKCENDFRSLIETPLQNFFTDRWLIFMEKILGLEVFLGTSRRYFVREMKSANFVKRWTDVLLAQGVTLQFGYEFTNFEGQEIHFKTKDNSYIKENFDHIFLYLGGGSWEKTDPQWPKIFEQKGIKITPFKSSNTGYHVDWNQDFLKEALRLPIKNVVFETSLGRKQGDLLVTEYGLEGTPIYFYGTSGEAILDLSPDRSYEQIIKKLREKESKTSIRSPMKLVKKYLSLSPAALSLLFFYTSEVEKKSLELFVSKIKRMPIVLGQPRPLDESISSKGGVCLSEINPNFSLKKLPNISLGGEMLDWDAPTGGFLILSCVAQGYYSTL
ncbi:MAG: TIGR03862 family flavoprotein [Bacteriovoracaceae bacterium]|nr:TIGR03862 family flavoprotein [Bacteriovoracaceae bacterium]